MFSTQTSLHQSPKGPAVSRGMEAGEGLDRSGQKRKAGELACGCKGSAALQHLESFIYKAPGDLTGERPRYGGPAGRGVNRNGDSVVQRSDGWDFSMFSSLTSSLNLGTCYQTQPVRHLECPIQEGDMVVTRLFYLLAASRGTELCLPEGRLNHSL